MNEVTVTVMVLLSSVSMVMSGMVPNPASALNALDSILNGTGLGAERENATVIDPLPVPVDDVAPVGPDGTLIVDPITITQRPTTAVPPPSSVGGESGAEQVVLLPDSTDTGTGTSDTGTATGTETFDTGIATGAGTADTGTSTGTGTSDTGTATGTGTFDTGIGTSDTGGSTDTGMFDTRTPHLDIPAVDPPVLPALQKKLNGLCAVKCKTELCYLADDNDCRNFITCDKDAMGRYHATLQPCAFGTYWAGLQLQKKITCDLPENVLCNIAYCAGQPVGTKYDHMDGNCKTHWECDVSGKPAPKCCADGFMYDDNKRDCVADVLKRCDDKCPIKKDPCLIPGTKKVYLDDGNCRTYRNCEDQIPHPVCCPTGQGYDVEYGCVDMPSCNATCPIEAKLECHLKPEPNRKNMYRQLLHGTNITLPCAPGTEFNYSSCGCATPVKTAKDNSCNKELEITFFYPDLLRAGSQKQVIVTEHGSKKEGPEWNGMRSIRFDGDLYYRTPFFQSQYQNLYIKLTYMPDMGATAGRQVLLSNCMNLDLGAPSMELSLQNGRLILDLVTDNINTSASTTQNLPVTVSVQYTPGVWNNFTAIYDGQKGTVYLLNENERETLFEQQYLTGPISVAAEGLDFGGCFNNRDRGEGYVGSLAHLEFSKCLKKEWLNEFFPKTPVRNV